MKKFFQIISSVKIAVICLLFLFVLTFWGTVAQVNQGLYSAQERFFHSFYFLAAGFIPFPGAQLILWVLFVNLVAAGFSHFARLRHWRYAGLKMSHAGLIVYFFAAYITFHVTQESNLHLAEGQGSNLSSSYQEWELAYWTDRGNVRQVTAIDTKGFKTGVTVDFNNPTLTVSVEQFFPNCVAFTKAMPADGIKALNASKITLLQPKEMVKEREKNIAGVMLTINKQRVLLYGLESKPTQIGEYFFNLRHKKYQLPFTIQLKDFKAEFYPGTQTPKSFESIVTVIKPKATRDVRIFMNNPMYDKDYAFYQASYDIDRSGREYSTFAVVKNGGRLLPYIASFLVFAGLVLHFLIVAFQSKRKEQ